METKSVKRTMNVCMIVCIMCLAAVHFMSAQTSVPNYYYDHGRDVVLKPTQTICKLDDSGKYLVPHLKYFFTYDDEQRVITKEAHRWNADLQSWIPSFMLAFTYGDSFTTIDYASWDKQEKSYILYTEKAVYQMEDDAIVSYAYFKRDTIGENWMLVENLQDLQIYPFLIGNGYLLAGN